MSNNEEADATLEDIEAALNILQDSLREMGTPSGKVLFSFSSSFFYVYQPPGQINSDIATIESDMTYAQHCVDGVDDDDEEKEDFVTVCIPN